MLIPLCDAFLSMEFSSIGLIRTPYIDPKETPIQPVGAKGVEGWIELQENYVEGLQDLDGFTYIILLYVFHKSKGYKLKVRPYLEKTTRGLFSTRFPARPNPIGISVVKLIKIAGNKVYIEDVDMLDGTPLLDIKPFIPNADNREGKIGWLENRVRRMRTAKADGRVGSR